MGAVVVEAQLGIAYEKPVFVSSQGGNIATNPPSHVTDQQIFTVFYTQDLPWSFAAVDLGSTYEIDDIELIVNAGLSKLN